MSDDWKEVVIPGVRPGWNQWFLDKVMSLISQDLYFLLDSCVPSDCVSLMDVQSLGNVFGGLINNYGWCRNRYNSTN
jgi:hypothetical protein